MAQQSCGSCQSMDQDAASWGLLCAEICHSGFTKALRLSSAEECIFDSKACFGG